MTDFDVRWVQTAGMKLVPVVARLLFAQQSATNWRVFSFAFADALDKGIIDKLAVADLQGVLAALQSNQPRNEPYVGLLVDGIGEVEDKLRETRIRTKEGETTKRKRG